MVAIEEQLTKAENTLEEADRELKKFEEGEKEKLLDDLEGKLLKKMKKRRNGGTR